LVTVYRFITVVDEIWLKSVFETVSSIILLYVCFETEIDKKGNDNSSPKYYMYFNVVLVRIID